MDQADLMPIMGRRKLSVQTRHRPGSRQKLPQRPRRLSTIEKIFYGGLLPCLAALFACYLYLRRCRFLFFTLIFLFARKQSPTGKKSVQPCLAKTYAMLNDELPNASQKRVSDPRPQSLSPKTPNVRLTTKRMFLSKSFAVK